MSTSQNARPLSPHLSVYRWQITNTLSILHRATGFALVFGLALMAVWLIAAAWSPDCFAMLQGFFASILGKLFLFGWTVAFFYHFANGLRHLNWDMGQGFALANVTSSGIFVLVFTAVATAATWLYVYDQGAL